MLDYRNIALFGILGIIVAGAAFIIWLLLRMKIGSIRDNPPTALALPSPTAPPLRPLNARRLNAKCPYLLKRLYESMGMWLEQKTRRPQELATSPLAWTLITLGSLYLLLFGFTFSLEGWKHMLTTPRGLVPFLTILFIGTLFIVACARANLLGAINPTWQLLLAILMPTILVLSLIAHFLFFAFDAKTKNPEQLPQRTPVATSSLQQPVALQTQPPSQSTPVISPIAQRVKLTGHEEFVKLFDLPPGKQARITYEGGEVCIPSISKKTFCIQPWGYKDKSIRSYAYEDAKDPIWKEAYRYSSIEGVQAGETLLVLGEIGSGAERVFQFMDNQKETVVQNITERILPLSLYFHDTIQVCKDSRSRFPSKKVAESFGHFQATCMKGFQSNPPSSQGAMEFQAQIIN